MKPRYPNLVRLNIPFEVINSDPLVENLMKIAETRPFLDEYWGTPQELKLLRRAKVRAVTYSNQIEGNHLNEEEVTAVLQGKKVIGQKKDINEVQNYYEAIDYVDRLVVDPRPLKLSDMCDLQRLVTSGLIDEKQCGRVRSVPVSIINASTGEKIDECPQPHELNDLLEDLWLWLEDTKNMNTFTRAFAFHFIAVSIHPFADGNGRTMRLMQHLLLLKGGQRIARLVPSETTIMQNRERYYSSIRQSRKLNSLNPIVEFLAECFAVSAEGVVEEARKLLRDSVGKTPQSRQHKILSNAKNKAEFHIQDVISWLPEVPRRTLERDLSVLVKKRVIKASGMRKGRVYSVLK